MKSIKIIKNQASSTKINQSPQTSIKINKNQATFTQINYKPSSTNINRTTTHINSNSINFNQSQQTINTTQSCRNMLARFSPSDSLLDENSAEKLSRRANLRLQHRLFSGPHRKLSFSRRGINRKSKTLLNTYTFHQYDFEFLIVGPHRKLSCSRPGIIRKSNTLLNTCTFHQHDFEFLILGP